MASLIYDSALYEELAGDIDYTGERFRVLLVGPGYLPDKAAHRRLSDVTDEIAGPGYDSGGAAVAVSVERFVDGSSEVGLGGALWQRASIAAAAAVYYQEAGGRLVAYIDFGGLVTASNGDFRLDRSVLQIAA